MYPEIAQFKSWLKYQYPNSSASVHYSSDLALFFSFVKKPPAKIRSKDVDRYISHSLQQGNKPATVNRRLSALRTFYYFLSMLCDLPLTCPVLPRHRLRKSYPLPRDVEDANIQALFNVVSCSRDKAMFLLMLDCGLRVGEVHLISLDDVYFDTPPYILVQGKGGRQRIVYLSKRAQDALMEWLNSRPVNQDRAVFISEHGKRLSVAGIQYRLRGYCKKAGVHSTCHQLRHTFGRRMAEAKLPITSLQSLLGHKSVRTTQIYVHLSNMHLHTEFDRIASKWKTPKAVNKAMLPGMRAYSPVERAVNWDSYLSNLPTWLAGLVNTYCATYLGMTDPVQQTRNRLCQLSKFFRWMLNHHKLPCLNDVTPRIWFAYVEIRLAAGIQPTSLNTALRTLCSFLKFAETSGKIICTRILEVRPLKTGETLPRDISQTQLNLLLKKADPCDRAWILLMAQSGLRTCEVRALLWQNVDLRKRSIRIDESKGLRSRVVFLSAPTMKALNQLPKSSKYVFIYNSHPLSHRYCQSRLKTLGKKCELKVIPHQLRCTCATTLLNAGMSIFGVQAILGHKYVDTTLRYARTYNTTIAKNYTQALKRLQKQSELK